MSTPLPVATANPHRWQVPRAAGKEAKPLPKGDQRVGSTPETMRCVMRIQLRVFLIMALVAGVITQTPGPGAPLHRSSRRPIPRVAVELRRGGSGAPLLVIHGELGVPGWLESFAELADHYDVIVPSLPGYRRSARPDWVMSVHDLAAWVTWFARDADLRTPVNVIGCSLCGGDG